MDFFIRNFCLKYSFIPIKNLSRDFDTPLPKKQNSKARGCFMNDNNYNNSSSTYAAANPIHIAMCLHTHNS